MPNVIASSSNIYCMPQPDMDNTPLEINNPITWGPSCWQFLHTASLCYPDNPSFEHRNGMYNFILGLGYSLPCEGCRTECLKYINDAEKRGLIDAAVLSKDNLFIFFWDLHNFVNKKNGLKVYTLEEARKCYQKRYKCEPCQSPLSTLIKILFMVLLVFVIHKILKRLYSG